MRFFGTKEKCHSSKSKIKPLPSISFQSKIWAILTFLWAGNCDSVKVFKKSVKLGAKAHKMAQNFKTSYLGLGMNFLDIFRAQNNCLVIGCLLGTTGFEF